jgi:hypothetical protein
LARPTYSLDDPDDCVAAWVAVLERGLLKRDFALIRRANEQLDRLGVLVCIGGQRYGHSEPDATAESRP